MRFSMQLLSLSLLLSCGAEEECQAGYGRADDGNCYPLSAPPSADGDDGSDGVSDGEDGSDPDDMDGDGSPASEDCNDDDASIHPGAVELCNDLDDDCDGDFDEDVKPVWYLDDDGDGYGLDTVTEAACEQPDGYAPDGGDCDDAQALIHPEAEETCDGTDEDCDGVEDNNAGEWWYRDDDGDGYGDEDDTLQACAMPSGFAEVGGDCDEGDDTIHPGASERCNGADDNCDEEIDEGATNTYYTDADGDGFGDRDAPVSACTQPGGTVVDNTDCDDTDGTTYPGATETCDGDDNDCDSVTDEGC